LKKTLDIPLKISIKERMKLKINTQVIVSPKCGSTVRHEFLGQIVDVVGGQYIVEDQDSDFFTVDEDEVSAVENE
jgi:hypothetical protein